MKKVMLTVSAFALVAMMAACGGSPESKAKDFGKQFCDCNKMEDATKKVECLDKLAKDAEEYQKTLKTAEDSAAYAKAYAEAIKCTEGEKEAEKAE